MQISDVEKLIILIRKNVEDIFEEKNKKIAELKKKIEALEEYIRENDSIYQSKIIDKIDKTFAKDAMIKCDCGTTYQKRYEKRHNKGLLHNQYFEIQKLKEEIKTMS